MTVLLDRLQILATPAQRDHRRLDDVPLGDLAAAFGRVVPVDAVHPLAARIWAQPYRKVAIFTAELLYGAAFGAFDRAWVWELASSAKRLATAAS